MIDGKLPPQAVDLEQAVLGACLLEKDAVYAALGILMPDMFYIDKHQKIFEVIRELFNHSNPVDQLTVCDALRKRGWMEIVGGAYEISELTNRVASGANVEFHARIIYEKYIAREMIRISAEVIKKSFDEVSDVFDILTQSTRQFLNLDRVSGTGNIEPHHRVSLALAQIEKAMQNKSVTGVPSGSSTMDALTGGWQKQDLITVSGRPGSGKSGFIIWIARNAGMNNFPTVMFSLEMDKTQIAMRELGMDNQLKYSKLRTGRITDDEFQQVVFGTSRIEDCPVYMDDDPILSPMILRSKLLKLKNEKNVQMAIIDYLNLMKYDGNPKVSRYDQISEIVRDVKRIAKELDMPIIMLCQLNRELEKESKTDKRPRLHHMRDAGTIEEASDVVMLLYRPAYYMDKIPEFPRHNADGEPEDNAFYVDFAKHKQGATGEVKLYTEIEKNIFRDWHISPHQNQSTSPQVRSFTEPINQETTEDLPF